MAKRLGVILLTTLLVSTLASMSLAAPEKILFTAWGNDAERETLTALVDRFNSEQDAVKVELLFPTGAYEDSVLTMIAGGAAPDVMQIQNGWGFSTFATLGALKPLDAFLARDEFGADLLVSERLLGELSYEGATYGLPKGWTTKVMAVNADMFAQAGLELPHAGWSLEEYRQNAIRLTNEDNNQYGSMILWDTLWMYLNGGRIFGDDNRTVLIDQDPAVIGVQFAFDANRDPRVTVQSNSVWSAESQGLWYGGRVAMWPDIGAWTLPTFNESIEGWNYELVAMPHNTTAPGAVPMAIQGFVMYANTEKADAAWEFMRWLSFSQTAQDILATGSLIPGLRASIDTWVAQGWKGFDAFMTELQYAAPEPINPHMSAVNSIIGEEWAKARTGEISVRAAHQEIARRVEALLSENE